MEKSVPKVILWKYHVYHGFGQAKLGWSDSFELKTNLAYDWTAPKISLHFQSDQ